MNLRKKSYLFNKKTGFLVDFTLLLCYCTMTSKDILLKGQAFRIRETDAFSYSQKD